MKTWAVGLAAILGVAAAIYLWPEILLALGVATGVGLALGAVLGIPVYLLSLACGANREQAADNAGRAVEPALDFAVHVLGGLVEGFFSG